MAENPYIVPDQQQDNVDYTAPQQPYYNTADEQRHHQQAVEVGGPPNQGSSRPIKNVGFLTSVPGIMNLVVITLLFFGWLVMSGWRGHIGSTIYLVHGDGSSFYFFTTLLPFFLMICYVLMVAFGLDKIWILNRVEWNLTVVINSGVWALFLIISCSIVTRKMEKHMCLNHNCAILETAAAFGFLSAFGLLAMVIYYFKMWKDGKPVHRK